MSQMQIGLLLLGGLVLLGMFAYNSWQARKTRPRQAEPAPELAPLLDREPTLSESDLQAMDLLEVDHLAISAQEKKPLLDALLDSVVPIALDAPVSGEAVLAAMPSTRRVGSKPFSVDALNASTGAWEFPQSGARYTQLQAGLQLANRAGPINDIEFSEFVVKMQAFCDAFGGTPDFPDMRGEVSRSRELDQFASEHDAQLGFELRAKRAAWSPSYIQQMAAREGFVVGPMPGRLVLPAGTHGQPSLLSLSFDTQAALSDDLDQSALRTCTLALDVTHVAREEQAFERMRTAARALAQSMDGALTDDRGMALSDGALDQIAIDIEQLYDRLDQHGLPAGSSLARRLFA
jgi:hypothetical protein